MRATELLLLLWKKESKKLLLLLLLLLLLSSRNHERENNIFVNDNEKRQEIDIEIFVRIIFSENLDRNLWSKKKPNLFQVCTNTKKITRKK